MPSHYGIGPITGMPRNYDPVREYWSKVGSGRFAKENTERLLNTFFGGRGEAGPQRVQGVLDQFMPGAGIAGIMAGPKAATANPVARNLAEQLREQGRSAEDIWRITGERHGQPWWLEHPDQVPRFEISDEALEYEPNLYSKWTPAAPSGRIEEAVGHPELFKAYPDLGEIRATHYPKWPHDAGWYGTNPEEIKVWERPGSSWGEPSHGVMAHELQHAIQKRERMARGGVPGEFSLSPDRAFEHYQRLAGEMDARAVQERLRMTPKERIARPFWLDYDLPIEQMILKR